MGTSRSSKTPSTSPPTTSRAPLSPPLPNPPSPSPPPPPSSQLPPWSPRQSTPLPQCPSTRNTLQPQVRGYRSNFRSMDEQWQLLSSKRYGKGQLKTLANAHACTSRLCITCGELNATISCCVCGCYRTEVIFFVPLPHWVSECCRLGYMRQCGG